MSRLMLHLLGPPRLGLDGEPVHIARRKAVALLGYLAVTGGRHSRDTLATLLWPEYDQSSARADLRRTLSLLNRTLGAGWLKVDRETAGLNPDAELWLDVHEFRHKLAACETHAHPPTEACPDCIPLLEDAVALYRDHFLAGFTLRDSAAFDEWQFFQTEGLKDELASALVRLANYHTSQGDFEPAIGYARRWLALDPLHEPAHRHLMVLYAQSNQRAAALRQYETCRQLLAEELGVEPSEKTQETYERLLKGELPIGPTAVEAILERELRTVGECPYRGLSPFREADAPFFFGREEFTERLSRAVRTRPMVAVIVGSSGSGKSSAVFAGLLPRLREEGNWLFANFRPGSQPFHALAAALLPILEIEKGTDLDETDRLVKTRKLTQALSEGDVLLYDAVERALDKSAGSNRLLLLVDQFEELYTLCTQPEVRRRFLDALLAAVEAVGESRVSPFVLLLTLRADFMGQALTHRPFADALQEAALIMGPMTREELRAAIEKPADKQGAALETGLVERLLDDVGQEPGNLPLLEFALTLLWERLDYGWMTHVAYEEIGRVEGALARYAQEVYDDLEESEREGARQIFVQLVQPGEGTADTRRVATQAELGDENWALVQHLADRRLVVTGRDETTGGETVDVVHEALIQGWAQLQAWIEADRTFRTWQERLRGALREWEISGQDEGALLRGVPLVEAEGWLGERGGELSPAEEAFIQVSRALRERRQAERERRRWRIVGGLAVGLVVALVLTGFAFRQRREALGAYSQSLAAHAQNALDEGDSATGLALALAANDIDQPPEISQRVLRQAAYAPGAHRRFVSADTFEGVEGPIYSLDASPIERVFLIGFDDGTVILWDPETETEIQRLVGHTGLVRDVAFSPGGKTALSCSNDRTVILWDLRTGQEIRRFSGHAGWVRAVAFSPDGRTVVSGGFVGDSVEAVVNPGELILWDLETGQEIHRFEGHPSGVQAVAFSPDGRTVLASAGVFGNVFPEYSLILWDVETGKVIHDFQVDHDNFAIAISPDGRTALTGDNNHRVNLWDLETGEKIETLEGHQALVTAVALTPDGRRAVSGDWNGQLILWDLVTGTPIMQATIHHTTNRWSVGDPSSVTVAVGPEGRTALSSSEDGTLILWNLLDAGEIGRVEGHAAEVLDAAFTPDGEYALTGGGDSGFGSGAEDNNLRLWNVETGELIRVFEGHAGAVFQVAISPDGRRALSGSLDGTLRLWNLETGAEIRRFQAHPGAVFAVAFSPNGRTALSGSYADDDVMILWDLESGEAIHRFAPTGTNFTQFVYNPDGRTAFSPGLGALILWNLETGQEIRHYSLDWCTEDCCTGFAIHPDGRTVFLASFSDVVELDLETGRELRRFGEHSGFRTRVEVTPDGRYLLSSDWDGTLILWDLETGQEIRRFRSDDAGFVFDIDISPDGRAALVPGTNGTASLWRLDLPMSLDQVHEWITANRYVRELTCAERELYGIGPLCEE